MAVHVDAAVVVLGTDGDFQGLPLQENAVIPIETDGLGVHMAQAVDGGSEEGAGSLQVAIGLGGEGGEALLQACGVLGIIQIDPAAFVENLVVDN